MKVLPEVAQKEDDAAMAAHVPRSMVINHAASRARPHQPADRRFDCVIKGHRVNNSVTLYLVNYEACWVTKEEFKYYKKSVAGGPHKTRGIDEKEELLVSWKEEEVEESRLY